MRLSAVPLAPLSSSRSTSADLMERLADGDPSAVGEIYDLHHGAVRSFARRLLADPASAEDLVHDVFVALPQAAKSYAGTGALRTFLMGIAVNHARHHVRSAARRRKAMERLATEPERSSASPENALHRKEVASALTRAMDQLPVAQRVAFVLCDIEERTSGEAASIAGVPEATIRTRLFHARKKLRELLSKAGHRKGDER